MILDKTTKIGIIGLGLIGGSYAQAFSSQGFEVGAIDSRKESIDFAIEHGWIAHGKSHVDANYIEQFNIVIFALYPLTFLDWLKQYQSYLGKNTLITDVTGVKGCIVYQIQDLLRSDLEYIGAHPMAGREVSGVENSNKEIFRDANYILTPTHKNTDYAISVCQEIGKIIGFKNITTLSPEKHDEMIAFLSQLTHCIAISLMTCRDTTSLAEYSGDSFRDLTRIAKINDNMWSELFLLNKEELLKQMELFEDAFKKLKQCIKEEKKNEICEIMRLSTSQRKLFDKGE